MKKYVVYNNDLKFEKSSQFNVDNVVWHTDDVQDNYNSMNSINSSPESKFNYRLDECVKNNFTYLDLSQLELEEFPIEKLRKWKHFDELKNVKYLFINNNSLKTVRESDIKYFPNIEVLDISHNCITQIEYYPPTLKEFSCYNNKITELKSHETIEKLDCCDNRIKIIGSYDKLTSLLCDNNSLESIGEYRNLDRLICKNNPISKIKRQPNLTHLDCSDTKLVGNLPELPNLTHLICNNTKINDVTGLDKLQSLEIIQTDITKIPYISTLKDLLIKKQQNIKLSSSYKIADHVKEHDKLFIIFQ